MTLSISNLAMAVFFFVAGLLYLSFLGGPLAAAVAGIAGIVAAIALVTGH